MIRSASLCIDETPMNITGNYGDKFYAVTRRWVLMSMLPKVVGACWMLWFYDSCTDWEVGAPSLHLMPSFGQVGRSLARIYNLPQGMERILWSDTGVCMDILIRSHLTLHSTKSIAMTIIVSKHIPVTGNSRSTCLEESIQPLLRTMQTKVPRPCKRSSACSRQVGMVSNIQHSTC